MKKLYKDREWLRKKYWDEGLTQREIAEECGVCRNTIRRNMIKFGISRRSDGRFPVNKSAAKFYNDPQWLRTKYIDERLSQRQIANLLNCSQYIIHEKLHIFDIPTRDTNEMKANYVNLTCELREFLDGELLGDGCLYPQNEISACYTHGSKYLEYLQWLRDQLTNWGLSQCGNFRFRKAAPGWGKGIWHYSTLAYRELYPEYRRWYSQRRKRVPFDLELTPTILRQWYFGDGSYIHDHGPMGRIRLHTEGFQDKEVDFLVEALNQLNIRCNKTNTNGGSVINISNKRGIINFFDYIGPCPKEIQNIYGYKWPSQAWKNDFNRTKWWNDELKILRLLWKPNSIRSQPYRNELLNKINRNWSAIQRKAYKLGLNQSNPDYIGDP